MIIARSLRSAWCGRAGGHNQRLVRAGQDRRRHCSSRDDAAKGTGKVLVSRLINARRTGRLPNKSSGKRRCCAVPDSQLPAFKFDRYRPIRIDHAADFLPDRLEEDSDPGDTLSPELLSHSCRLRTSKDAEQHG